MKGHFLNDVNTFWSKVSNREAGKKACWLWLGKPNNNGYGRFTYQGVRMPAHCFAYRTIVGEIPNGLVLDHKCRTRNCVNPFHLEPVTNVVNVLRGEGIFAQKKRQTHCERGHLLSGRNLRIRKNGTRCCKECDKLRTRKYRERGDNA